MKKKIGIYLEAAPACGGAYQYNRILVEALSTLPQEKYEIYAIYGTSHWEDKLREKQIASTFLKPSLFWQRLQGLWRRLKLPVKHWRKLVAPFHPLMRAMNKMQCDIWLFPSQDAYAYWLPVKSFGVIHDLMHRYEKRFPEVGNAKEVAAREFHYSMMCRFSEGILVDSNLGKLHVIESYGLNAKKCHVLPYIAPPLTSKVSPLPLAEKYNLPSKYFFYPAQFWQHKNHENLLKALHKCIQVHPNMQLVLVGSPKNYYEATLNLIQKLDLKNHVKILGLVPDEAVPLFYQKARALIMPTFFGPTNIPPLEAFAFDCPVAISGVYGMPEQLQEAALYFDPNSVEEIQDCMLKLWENDSLCKELIEKGRAHHESWQFQHFVKRLEDILL